MIKWGDYSTFNIPTDVLKDIQQMWECQIYCNHPFCGNGMLGRPVMNIMENQDGKSKESLITVKDFVAMQLKSN